MIGSSLDGLGFGRMRGREMRLRTEGRGDGRWKVGLRTEGKRRKRQGRRVAYCKECM